MSGDIKTTSFCSVVEFKHKQHLELHVVFCYCLMTPQVSITGSLLPSCLILFFKTILLIFRASSWCNLGSPWVTSCVPHCCPRKPILNTTSRGTPGKTPTSSGEYTMSLIHRGSYMHGQRILKLLNKLSLSRWYLWSWNICMSESVSMYAFICMS